MSSIVLFDLDGTLAESRQLVSERMVQAVESLSTIADVGIVTGSDIDYLIEQLPIQALIRFPNIILYPCNGTKKFIFVNEDIKLVYQNSLDKILGEQYATLLNILYNLQERIKVENFDLPTSAEFVQERSSMINWCPIGRAANRIQRQKFIELDKKLQLRNKYLDALNQEMLLHDIRLQAVLGGDTSFDIYPIGWDKTFCLTDCQSYSNIWFIGDRCKVNGNDYTIYNKLNHYDTAFETSGPVETIKIIQTISERILDERYNQSTRKNSQKIGHSLHRL